MESDLPEIAAEDTSAEFLDGTQVPEEPRSPSWFGTWLPRIGVATVVVSALWFGSQWVFGSIVDFLMMMVVSIFISFSLLPAVEALARRGWRRGLATAVVMFGGALLAIGFVVAMTQVVVGQILSFLDNLPEYAETATRWLTDLGFDVDLDNVLEELSIDRQKVAEFAADAIGGVFGFANSVIGLVFSALTISLFVFYILADLPKMREAVLHRFRPERQRHIDLITKVTIEKVGGYVYSRGLLAAASAVFHGTWFLVIDLPYAIALGIWVGVISQFIPTIGTYLAGALPVVIALFISPVTALLVLAAVLVYQQIENYLLSPRITANTMQLHPAVAFGAVIVGGSLLGGIGALIALPVAATIVALIQTYTATYEIQSEGFVDSEEDYEDRVRARAAEKLAKRGNTTSKLKKLVGAD